MSRFAAALALGILAACMTAPAPPAPARFAPPAPPSPAVPAVPSAPAAPSVVPPAAPIAVSVDYQRVAFDALPASSPADWIGMWPAMLRSCAALAQREAWRAACAGVATVNGRDGSAIRGFFAANFDAYRMGAQRSDGSAEPGLVTGYYEPLLRGSRTRDSRHAVPLYRVPRDLVAVDLAGVYPDLAGLRLRGKLDGSKLVPYPTRAEITGGNALKGQELLWVDDPIDAFFLQVQGSGRVRLADGTSVRVGYADQNGHPYRSIGRWLIDKGELTLEAASMQGIKAWAARYPGRIKELLNQNPSFVFFRELPLGDPNAGPTGGLGVALTPGRSVAVDPKFVPLGVPLVLMTTDPSTGAPLTRPVVAQDTGSAIRGALRFDLFWGFGEEAGIHAGRQRHPGIAWLLLPQGQPPDAMLRR